jgi:hypothetical protein
MIISSPALYNLSIVFPEKVFAAAPFFGYFFRVSKKVINSALYSAPKMTLSCLPNKVSKEGQRVSVLSRTSLT